MSAPTSTKNLYIALRDRADQIKRTGNIFESQYEHLQARALITHNNQCDPLTCSKNLCQERTADIIVSVPYKVTKEMRINYDERSRMAQNEILIYGE